MRLFGHFKLTIAIKVRINGLSLCETDAFRMNTTLTLMPAGIGTGLL